MQHPRTLAVLVALSVSVLIPQPAQAQFGGLKNAIKKKASEVINGKDSKSDSSTSGSASNSSSRSSASVEITSDAIERFQTALNAEIAKRGLTAKRNQCVKQAEGTQEYMTLMMSSTPEIEKVTNSSMSEEKQMAEMQRIGAAMKVKEEAFMAKKCGPVPEQMTEVEYEGVGAEAGGFTQAQYAMLKERIQPFCEGIAKGSSSATDQRLAYSDSEMSAMRPRCVALLSSIRKTN